MNGKLLQK